MVSNRPHDSDYRYEGGGGGGRNPMIRWSAAFVVLIGVVIVVYHSGKIKLQFTRIIENRNEEIARNDGEQRPASQLPSIPQPERPPPPPKTHKPERPPEPALPPPAPVDEEVAPEVEKQ